MPEKDPTNYQFITYVWVIGLASWGGLASYVRKIKSGKTRFSIGELIGEVCISAFVGVITFYLCESAALNQVVSAALIGISGHMGSRAIYMAEKGAEKLVKRWFGIADDSAH